MIYDKTNVSQSSHESGSVTSDGLTKCIQAMVSLNIYKNSANKFGRKTGFKIENEIEDQDQSIPKLIGILTQVFCTFGPNLVILAWTGDELSCRQAQNGVTFDFEVKFDLEGQGQSPPQNNRDLNQGLLQLWSKFGDSSLNGWWVIVRTSKWLPHTWTDGRTDTQTDAGNDNTRRPKLASGKNECKIPEKNTKLAWFFFYFPVSFSKSIFNYVAQKCHPAI